MKRSWRRHAGHWENNTLCRYRQHNFIFCQNRKIEHPFSPDVFCLSSDVPDRMEPSVITVFRKERNAFMRLIANDVRSRVVLSRLLVKADRNPEYKRVTGIEDTSRFQSEAANEEKEVVNHVEHAGTHNFHNRAV